MPFKGTMGVAEEAEPARETVRKQPKSFQRKLGLALASQLDS